MRISAAPESVSITVTHFRTSFSSSTRPLSIPRPRPASIQGISRAARFRISTVRMPHRAYRKIRRVFSTRNTTQMLALKEALSSVTRLR